MELTVLSYEYVADVSTRRTPYRDEHLELAKQFVDQGQLLMIGALGAPPSGALLVFTGRSAAEKFAAADPYAEAGLITSHRIDPWNVVMHGALPGSS